MTDTHEIVTLITGADKGIGFATAEGLGKLGQHVLVGSRNTERGQAAVDKLTAEGIKATLIVLDVTDKDTIKQAVDTINKQFGYLSVLINNAGIALDRHQVPSKLSTDVIRKEYDVNFFGMIDVTQAMLPLLKKDTPAKIINLSSNMGSFGLTTDPNNRLYNVSAVGYQSSKAAVNFFTVDLSKELADEGITVNSVNPGWTATEFGGRPKDAPKIPGMQDIADGARQSIKMASLPREDKTTGTFSEFEGQMPW
ncbi:SDR family oxidoreductase [Lacticaseibacillus zhaodongensis]|uniref:SDR family oxidoreductase n=1 Tax=Lacticaseibacillus zhaodongensis TaxID=2668065 RepID=UPI0012D2B9C5|nr:SDR family oxidoreductase [Lacticaseibacillus zhaodongensis]